MVNSVQRGSIYIILLFLASIILLCGLIVWGSFILRDTDFPARLKSMKIPINVKSMVGNIPTNLSQTASQDKNLLTVKRESSLDLSKNITIFYSFSPSSKTEKEILRLEGQTYITEAEVSPDGKKFYYIFGEDFLTYPTQLAIMENDKKKTVQITDNQNRTLSHPGLFEGGVDKDCYWSPDSIRITCRLLERESSSGAGNGITVIYVIDSSTGEVQEVITSDKVIKPLPARVNMEFYGWINSDKILLSGIETDGTSALISTARTFYILNIQTGSLDEQFSYTSVENPRVLISPEGQEFYRLDKGKNDNEKKIIKYNAISRQQTDLAILTNEEPLYISQAPVLSEDKKKIVLAFLDKVYNVDTVSGTVSTFKLPWAVFKVQALMNDGVSYVVDKTDDALYYNGSDTNQNVRFLKGKFIGAGYF